MNEDLNSHLTPEVLKEMTKVYSSKMFTKITLTCVAAACLTAVVLLLTGCSTTKVTSMEQEHCGNSVKMIVCKNPM
jgi:hypothetical protein